MAVLRCALQEGVLRWGQAAVCCSHGPTTISSSTKSHHIRSILAQRLLLKIAMKQRDPGGSPKERLLKDEASLLQLVQHPQPSIS